MANIVDPSVKLQDYAIGCDNPNAPPPAGGGGGNIGGGGPPSITDFDPYIFDRELTGIQTSAKATIDYSGVIAIQNGDAAITTGAKIRLFPPGIYEGTTVTGGDINIDTPPGGNLNVKLGEDYNIIAGGDFNLETGSTIIGGIGSGPGDGDFNLATKRDVNINSLNVGHDVNIAAQNNGSFIANHELDFGTRNDNSLVDFFINGIGSRFTIDLDDGSHFYMIEGGDIRLFTGADIANTCFIQGNQVNLFGIGVSGNAGSVEGRTTGDDSLILFTLGGADSLMQFHCIGTSAHVEFDIGSSGDFIIDGNGTFEINADGIQVDGLVFRECVSTQDQGVFVLVNNQSASPVLTFNTNVSANAYPVQNCRLDYSVEKESNTDFGTIHIFSNGTTAHLATTGGSTGTTGVSFSVAVSAGIVTLNYATTNGSGNGSLQYAPRFF